METHSSCCIVILSLVYLCLTVHPTLAGKCSGKWAIHACFGGNGKRSDPRLSGLEETQRRGSLLRDLLLRDSYQPSEFMDTQNDPQDIGVGDSPSYKNFDADEDDISPIPAESPSDVSRLLSMLRFLKLEKKMRRAAEELN